MSSSLGETGAPVCSELNGTEKKFIDFRRRCKLRLYGCGNSDWPVAFNWQAERSIGSNLLAKRADVIERDEIGAKRSSADTETGIRMAFVTVRATL